MNVLQASKRDYQINAGDRPMTGQPPPILYAYRPHRTRLDREIQLLTKNFVHFSTPDLFNDPFEAKPHFMRRARSKISMHECRRFAARDPQPLSELEREKLAKEMFRWYRKPEHVAGLDKKNTRDFGEMFQGTSMFCLASDPGSIVMWSYYASGHKGLCAGFSFATPWESLPNRSNEIVGMEPERVIYRNRYPTIDLGATRGQGLVKAVDDGLLRKGRGWSHEREWRLLRPESPSGLQPFPPGALRQLILGACMPAARRKSILKLVRLRGLPLQVYHAVAAKDRYELNFESIDWQREA